MERFIDLIQSSGDAAVAIDRRQRIVFSNRAFQQLLGYDASDVIDRPCYEIIGGTARNGCRICQQDCAVFRDGQQGRPVASKEIRTKTADGREVWLGLSTLFVPSSWSELSVLIHLITDISRRKELERSVGRLLDEYAVLTDNQSSGSGQPTANLKLSVRENDVLQVLATGATTNEIAARLSISPATARNHIHHILSKLGVRNRLEAIALALREGLLQTSSFPGGSRQS